MRIDINNNSPLRFSLQGLLLAVMLCVGVAQASAGGKYEKANNDVANVASLQRGARNFMNYCAGCHSAKYVRFSLLVDGLHLTEAQVRENLMFRDAKLGDTLTVTMPPADAEKWFGKTPPDLSLIARARGTDYLYSFLKSFYLDPTRPTGMNNHVLPGASMPNVLWELQGVQKAVYEGHTLPDGSVAKHFTGFETVTQGTLTPKQYDEFVRDTVNFLDYIGEPVQLQRRALGFKVLGFLLLLFLLSYALKKEYWKDIK